MKKLTICACLLTFGLTAQTNKKRTGPETGTQKVTRHTSTTTYSYEKTVNGKTVHYFTKEQFNQLPSERKSYYLSNKEQYRIIGNPQK